MYRPSPQPIAQNRVFKIERPDFVSGYNQSPNLDFVAGYNQSPNLDSVAGYQMRCCRMERLESSLRPSPGRWLT